MSCDGLTKPFVCSSSRKRGTSRNRAGAVGRTSPPPLRESRRGAPRLSASSASRSRHFVLPPRPRRESATRRENLSASRRERENASPSSRTSHCREEMRNLAASSVEAVSHRFKIEKKRPLSKWKRSPDRFGIGMVTSMLAVRFLQNAHWLFEKNRASIFVKSTEGLDVFASLAFSRRGAARRPDRGRTRRGGGRSRQASVPPAAERPQPRVRGSAPSRAFARKTAEQECRRCHQRSLSTR